MGNACETRRGALPLPLKVSVNTCSVLADPDSSGTRERNSLGHDEKEGHNEPETGDGAGGSWRQ